MSETILVCDYCGHEVNEDAPGCCGEVHHHEELAVGCDGCDSRWAKEELRHIAPEVIGAEGRLCPDCVGAA